MDPLNIVIFHSDVSLPEGSKREHHEKKPSKPTFFMGTRRVYRYVYIYIYPTLAMVYGRVIEVVDPPIMNPEIMKGVAYIAQLVQF